MEFLSARALCAPRQVSTQLGSARRRFLITACGLVVCALAPGPSEAARRWKGRVVDAETGQPLEGVVLLMYWERYEASLGGWAGGELVAAEETVTDAEGRFSIRSHWSYTIPGVIKVNTPEAVIFKRGYGRARFASARWRDEIKRGQEVEIAMPPLRSREERIEFLRTVTWSDLVPIERAKRLWAEKDAEYEYLRIGK